MSELFRLATVDDATACAEIYAPFVSDTAVSFESVPLTPDDMARRMAEYSEVAPWIVYERDGRVLGYAYGSRFRPRPAYRWCAEASAYLAAEARGGGVGTRIARLLIDLLREQGFQSVYGVIALPNPASERLSEKLGMKHVGTLPKAGFKQGSWHDVAQWHMELQPATTSPTEPKTVAECIGTPKWAQIFANANR